jgi:uncharacterized protein (DUF488 family)
MEMTSDKIIWTIGHSTKTFDDFTEILKKFDIELIADIRSLPGSRKFPQFNKENLELTLPANNINYIHIPKLGGRRKVNKDSHNTAWRHPAFRGYADYMETDDFLSGIEELTSLAEVQKTAFMCSEALWWRCHRAMISDYLKLSGWHVLHIFSGKKVEEHSYTDPAKIVNDKLDYTSS